MTEHPQDREDRITARILAILAGLIVLLVVGVLLFKEIPSKNEIILGTVVGFLFGQVVAPVFRKFFGGLDTETRKAQVAQGEALSSAVAGLAGSAPVTDAPQQVEVVNAPKDPVPVSKAD